MNGPNKGNRSNSNNQRSKQRNSNITSSDTNNVMTGPGGPVPIAGAPGTGPGPTGYQNYRYHHHAHYRQQQPYSVSPTGPAPQGVIPVAVTVPGNKGVYNPNNTNRVNTYSQKYAPNSGAHAGNAPSPNAPPVGGSNPSTPIPGSSLNINVNAEGSGGMSIQQQQDNNPNMLISSSNANNPGAGVANIVSGTSVGGGKVYSNSPSYSYNSNQQFNPHHHHHVNTYNMQHTHHSFQQHPNEYPNDPMFGGYGTPHMGYFQGQYANSPHSMHANVSGSSGVHNIPTAGMGLPMRGGPGFMANTGTPAVVVPGNSAAKPSVKPKSKALLIIDPTTNKAIDYKKPADDNKTSEQEEEKKRLEKEETLKKEKAKEEALKKQQEEERLAKEAKEAEERAEKERLEKEQKEKEERERKEAEEKERARLETEARLKREAEEAAEQKAKEEEERKIKEEQLERERIEEAKRLQIEIEQKEKERVAREAEEAVAKEKMNAMQKRKSEMRRSQPDPLFGSAGKTNHIKSSTLDNSFGSSRVRLGHGNATGSMLSGAATVGAVGDEVGLSIQSPQLATSGSKHGQLPVLAQLGGGLASSSLSQIGTGVRMDGQHRGGSGEAANLERHQHTSLLSVGPIKVKYSEICWSPYNVSGEKRYTIEFMELFQRIVLRPTHGFVLHGELDRSKLSSQSSLNSNSGGGQGGFNNKRPEMRTDARTSAGFRGRGSYGNNSSQHQRNNNNNPNMNAPNKFFNEGNDPNYDPNDYRRTHSNKNKFSQNQRGGGVGGGGGSRVKQPKYEKAADTWTPATIATKGKKTKAEDLAELADLTEEEREEKESIALETAVLVILNKLTIERFDALSKQMIELPITTVGRLDRVIRLIFDKALDEPIYCKMYAQLCKLFDETPLQLKDVKDEKKQQFRWLLLKKCQNEFEKETDGQFTMTDGVAAEDEDELMVRAKLRMLGNIRFVGELYQVDLISNKIMWECLNKLMNVKLDPSSTNPTCIFVNDHVPSCEAMECLHQLFFTIGKKMDDSGLSAIVDLYIKKVEELSKTMSLPTRIRCKLEDILDLRASRWVPRIKETGPKTIGEVHEDAQRASQKAAKEALMKQKQLGSLSHGGGNSSGMDRRSNSQSGRAGNLGHGGQRMAGQGLMASNEWSVVGKIGQLGQTMSSDKPSRKLSPSGGGLATGSAGWKSTSKNVFSSLEGANAHDSSKFHSNKLRGSKSVVDHVNGSVNGSAVGSLAQSPEALSVVKTSTDALTRTSKDTEKDVSIVCEKLKLEPEDFAVRIKGIFKEYTEIHDVNEVMECLQELDYSEYGMLIVEAIVRETMSKKDAVRVDAYEFLSFMCNDKHIVSTSDFYVGINIILIVVEEEDIATDAPMLWRNLGEYLGYLIAKQPDDVVDESKFTLQDYVSKVEKFAEVPNYQNQSATILVSALNVIKNHKGIEFAKQVWADSKLSWDSLVKKKKDTVENFLKSKDFPELAAC